jgi:hypothetical protein
MALNLVEEYLIEDGFPEVIVKNLNSEEYLGILFDSILFKDVVKRYKVRFSSEIGISHPSSLTIFRATTV